MTIVRYILRTIATVLLLLHGLHWAFGGFNFMGSFPMAALASGLFVAGDFLYSWWLKAIFSDAASDLKKRLVPLAILGYVALTHITLTLCASWFPAALTISSVPVALGAAAVIVTVSMLLNALTRHPEEYRSVSSADDADMWIVLFLLALLISGTTGRRK